jgi:hypothetical protein
MILSAGMVLWAAGAFAAAAVPLSPAAPRQRHLIYVHGRIVQMEQSARPHHAERGYYELDQILQTFRNGGFEVIGGIRPRDATVSGAADDLVSQVRRLMASGARAEEITVVGASMGASISLLASARLGDPDLSFALLGTCLSADVPAQRERETMSPRGQILVIREESDETTTPCAAWNELGAGAGLSVREVVIRTGQGHGFLYRPMREWVEPLMEWAGADGVGSCGCGRATADPDAPARAP